MASFEFLGSSVGSAYEACTLDLLSKAAKSATVGVPFLGAHSKSGQ